MSHDSNSSLHEPLSLCQHSSHNLHKSTMFHQVAEGHFEFSVSDGLTHLIKVIYLSGSVDML